MNIPWVYVVPDQGKSAGIDIASSISEHMKTKKESGLISGIFRLVDGSLAQQHRFENISTNLANVNTNGFKKSVISFDKALSLNNQSSTDFSKGAVVHTGNKLDLALGGAGFFKVATPEGTRYTRDGAFTLDQDGKLITVHGYQVLGSKPVLLFYHVTQSYNPDQPDEERIPWNDPQIGFDWSVKNR